MKTQSKKVKFSLKKIAIAPLNSNEKLVIKGGAPNVRPTTSRTCETPTLPPTTATY